MNLTTNKIPIVVCLVILLVCLFSFVTSPSQNFPTNKVVMVQSGESLTTIAINLYNAGAISSKLLFKTAVILQGGEKKVIQGDYLLDNPENTFALARRFVKGDFHMNLVKITIPEGWDTKQISNFLITQFKHFDTSSFLQLAKTNEGYLFPETYFFSPLATPEKIIQTMRNNFDIQTAKIPEIKTFGKPISDIVTMASIIEGEAKAKESRKIVSGILWKRLEIGMPLQVDSTFMYINGKNTYELTTSDLKIDSLYNTYLYKGLPPGPINNPGTDSVRAAVTPIPSDYLYFFSSRDGEMYYAKTFEEHKKNIASYSK